MNMFVEHDCCFNKKFENKLFSCNTVKPIRQSYLCINKHVNMNIICGGKSEVFFCFNLYMHSKVATYFEVPRALTFLR